MIRGYTHSDTAQHTRARAYSFIHSHTKYISTHNERIITRCTHRHNLTYVVSTPEPREPQWSDPLAFLPFQHAGGNILSARRSVRIRVFVSSSSFQIHVGAHYSFSYITSLPMRRKSFVLLSQDLLILKDLSCNKVKLSFIRECVGPVRHNVWCSFVPRQLAQIRAPLVGGYESCVVTGDTREQFQYVAAVGQFTRMTLHVLSKQHFLTILCCGK